MLSRDGDRFDPDYSMPACDDQKSGLCSVT